MEAFSLVKQENFHATVHAGEAFGLPSIWQALQLCGAERLGHGVRILDDITVGDDGAVRLGRLASYVRDGRVPLELCPSSNVHTGAVRNLAEHPIGMLRRLGFRATINTDNRLMSGVSLSSETARCAEVFGWAWADLRWLSINAMKSAFCDFDERLALINGVIKPGYDALAAQAAFRVSGPGGPAKPD
jgi:adenosine deaminase